jgi:hypothetical protein
MPQHTLLDMIAQKIGERFDVGELPYVVPPPALPIPEPASPREWPLRERLLRGVTIASPEDTSRYFKSDDRRWGETVIGDDSPTGHPMIFINDDKFARAGVTSRTPEMVTSESIHFLKLIDPARWKKLRDTALADTKYQRWNNERYERAKKEGEDRPKDVWHDVSSFDQVIGGYIFAQNPSMPTMQEWNRDELPIGQEFRNQLDSLAKDLGVNTGRR